MLGARLWALSPPLQPDGTSSAAGARDIDGGADGKTRVFEWVFARKDGGCFDTEVTLSGITLRGQGYVLCIVRDVTARKQADAREKQHERELFQAGKLASLGTLVSGIAHEINNPNNFIRLSVQNLEDIWKSVQELFGGDAAAAVGFELRGMPYGVVQGMITQMLSRIVEGSKRIERMVAGLRDYARRDEGALGERVEVNAVVSSALTILSNMVNKATAAFTLNLAPALPAVRGNNQQIEQVIINLLTNACQALRSRADPVTICTEASPDGGFVVVTVSDGGVGIPQDDIPRITDPFFTTKRDRGGTGLGLSISSRIVQNHGGIIEFSSRPGAGTTATVRLPILREEAVT
jgi:signal transduction histidine kinase